MITVILMGLEGVAAIGLAAWAWQRGNTAGYHEGYGDGGEAVAQERWSGPGIAVEVSPPLDADPDTAEFLGWAAELRERSQDWEPPAEAEVVALADPAEPPEVWASHAAERLGLGGWRTEAWAQRMPWEQEAAA